MRALARRRNISLAAVLRQAVDAFLADDAAPDRRQRARAVAGRFRAARPGSVSEDHDAAAADAFSG